ncbi:MAG: alpha-amylase family glycosyl hydrolase, partial [Erysipelotrichaceae bacterium]
MKKILILLLVVLTACSNTAKVKRKTVDELAILLKGSNADVFASEVSTAYNIFPISYADSNGDGFGDFKGIIEHLDVLNDGDPKTTTDLGINAIWLNPISPSDSYHKYDVKDYYAVDPQFGTLDDFKALVAACKQRGIKLILDMVFNHTAIDHPWFEKGISGDKKYRDYYRIEAKLTNAQYPDKTGWYYTNSLAYYASFWDKMPELNAQSEAVRTELKNILKFWMDLGVEGFRYDAAPRIYDKNEYPVGTPTMELNKQFWMEMKEYVKSVNPDIFLLAEVWLPANQAAAYAVGFDSMFNFDLASGILKTVKDGYQ